MADSLLNLGGYTIMPFEPNWRSEPGSAPSLLRRNLGYPGTKQTFASMTDRTPVTFHLMFTLTTRQEIYELQDWFDDMKGRAYAFWVKYPSRVATLAVNASNGDEVLYCDANDVHLTYRGYERVYLLMSDGDVLTRHVANMVHNTATERVEITLTDALDRAVTTATLVNMGRLLFCRFDADALVLRHATRSVAETELSFYELVREYPEATS